jgi:RND family efflux transporter MFP subunit
MKRRIVIIVWILVAAVVVVGAWKLIAARRAVPAEQTKKPTPLVTTEPARQTAISRVAELTGSIEPTKVARMASPAEGPILTCTVREGDRVQRGDIVVRVGRSQAAASAVEAAREELRKQEEEVRRVEQLVKSGAIPGDQLDNVRANFKRAEALVAAAQMGAGDYEITAPWDGIVSRLWIAEGNYVAPRAPLVEIFDPASLVLRFAVPEAEAAAVHAGQTAQVQLDAHPDRTLTGTVIRVYPELDRRMRTRTVEAELKDAPTLIPGMFARVGIVLQTVPEAIVISANAVVVTPQGKPVAYVIKDGKAEQRPVTLGIENAGRVQVLSGIAAGDVVVTAGMEKLKPGVDVRVAGAGKGGGK